MNKLLKLKIIEHYGSQVSFATKIGDDETLVSRIVRGWRNLPPDKQKEWAKALHTKRSLLFK